SCREPVRRDVRGGFHIPDAGTRGVCGSALQLLIARSTRSVVSATHPERLLAPLRNVNACVKDDTEYARFGGARRRRHRHRAPSPDSVVPSCEIARTNERDANQLLPAGHTYRVRRLALPE